jgi:hypothetical protein
MWFLKLFGEKKGRVAAALPLLPLMKGTLLIWGADQLLHLPVTPGVPKRLGLFLCNSPGSPYLPVCIAAPQEGHFMVTQAVPALADISLPQEGHTHLA